MRIACLQYTAEADTALSASRLYPLFSEALTQQPDLIALPECALFLSRSQDLSRTNALSITSPEILRLQTLARENAVHLVVGSLIMRIGETIRNRTLVIDRLGDIQAIYDKIHLFDVHLPTGEFHQESALFTAGSQPVVASVDGVSVGLSICFDLRFPKLYRYYAKQGVSIMVVPSAFTRSTGEAHWFTLLRARAIENGCFVVATGQCGRTLEGRETFGHSVVFDPWGTEMGSLGDSPGVLIVDLDIEQVSRVRGQIPVATQDRDF